MKRYLQFPLSQVLMYASTLAALLVMSLHVDLAHAAGGVASFAGHGADALAAIGLAGVGRISASIQSMREERNTIANDLRRLLDDHPGEKWGPEQQKVYDAKMGDIERIEARVKNEQRLLDQAAEEHFDEQLVDAVKRSAKSGKPKSESRKLYAKWLRHGDKGLSMEEHQAIRNTMSTTTPSQGGYTVDSEVAAELIEALSEFGAMREVATVMRTAGGNPLSFPSTDGTAEIGEIVPENTLASSQDISFGTVSLAAYKFGSKIVAIPIELIQDSAIDVEDLVRRRVQERIARIEELKFTVGTGTGEPTGIVTAASAGKVGTTGQTTTVTYDDLIDLEHAVNRAYRRNAKFMFADSALATLRKLKDDQGRPIWIPGYYDNGIAAGIPDTVIGRPYVINEYMPDPAANAKSVLYGDFSKYIIRDVMSVQVFRFEDSYYVSRGQVGFLAWARAGGNLTDAQAVKYYQHSAT